MKVTLVTLAYDPAFAFGGPGRVVQTNARELVQRGHQVSVHCTNRLNTRCKMSKETFERTDEGVRVVYHNTWYVPGWPGSFGPTFSPSFRAAIQQEARETQVIHINEARAFTTMESARAARKSRTPLVLQPHGSLTLGLRSQWLKHAYDIFGGRKVYSEAARVIALSSDEANDCAVAGIDRERIAVVGNSVDVTAWARHRGDGTRFRRRHNLPDGPPLLLFLGRLDRKKGPDLLLRAWAESDVVDSYLAFVGPDDGILSNLTQLTKDLRLTDRTVFTGYLDGADLLDAYAAADLFALPARFDSFPIALAEAMSCGLPILTTSTNQASSLVEGRAGLVVEPNTEALAYAISKLLTNADLRQRFSLGARAVAEQELSITSAVDKLEAVYDEAIQQSQP